MLVALAEQLAGQRRLGAKLPRVAVRFVLTDGAVHTLLLDGDPVLLDGDVTPPGVPRVSLRASSSVLVAVISGARSAADAAAAGELSFEGRADLLAQVSAGLPASKSWLTVRM